MREQVEPIQRQRRGNLRRIGLLRIGRAAVRPDERVLRDLLGVLLIAQQLIGHRVDPVPIPAYELVKRGRVAAFKAVNQHAV